MLIAEPRTQLTVADFEAWVNQPEQQGRFFELHGGEIVEMSPSGLYSSSIGMVIGSALFTFVRQHHLGLVTGENGGYQMDTDTLFAPDVAFISQLRLPQAPLGFGTVPPDLAVEVLSPTDKKRVLRHKAEEYLTYGTRMVWLVFPTERVVEVYTPDQDVQSLTINGTLDGGAILPSFTLPVSELFTT